MLLWLPAIRATTLRAWSRFLCCRCSNFNMFDAVSSRSLFSSLQCDTQVSKQASLKMFSCLPLILATTDMARNLWVSCNFSNCAWAPFSVAWCNLSSLASLKIQAQFSKHASMRMFSFEQFIRVITCMAWALFVSWKAFNAAALAVASSLSFTSSATHDFQVARVFLTITVAPCIKFLSRTARASAVLAISFALRVSSCAFMIRLSSRAFFSSRTSSAQQSRARLHIPCSLAKLIRSSTILASLRCFTCKSLTLASMALTCFSVSLIAASSATEDFQHPHVMRIWAMSLTAINRARSVLDSFFFLSIQSLCLSAFRFRLAWCALS
mmetsp:Transcript_44342/g.117616  ORF Transcript_44342/g.117616 Transcript_44342/m.117616 type:complete len:325 (+) Transcript_44342:782-1756(+)